MSSELPEAVVELSAMQKGMLFHSLYAPDQPMYVNQSVFALDGELNRSALEAAWQRVVDRHQVLRCSFFWERLASPVQAIHRHLNFEVISLNWTALREEEQEKKLTEFLLFDKENPFHLKRPPQMRITLVQISEKQHWMIWTRHHILFDGWSQALLLKELFQLYEIFSYGLNVKFEEDDTIGSRTKFESYVRWIQGNTRKDADQYWRKLLQGYTPYESTDREVSVQAEIGFQISDAAQSLMDRECRDASVTPSMWLLAIWGTVLARWRKVKDLVFGLTCSGRPAEIYNIDSMVGLFINTLPVRICLDSTSTVSGLAVQLLQQQSKIQEYQHVPLLDIQQACGLTKDQRLFDSIAVVGNFPTEFEGLQFQCSLRVSRIRNTVQNSFPLTFRAVPGKRWGISLLFDPSFIPQSDAASLLTSFEEAVAA